MSGAPTETTSASEEARGASGSFSTLTYNVAGLPQGINADQFPEQHIPIISPLLNDYDVVVVQEDFAYTDLLRAEADHEFKTEPHPGPGTLNPIARQTAAVGDGLNVFSRYPLGELDRVPWTECGAASGDCLSLKGFAATTLALEDEVSVDLYTLHLDAGGEDTAVRGANLDQLATHLEDNTEGAVILGGDWNLNYEDDPDGDQLRAFLERTGLQDVCDVVDCGADDDVIDRFLFRSGDDVTLTPTRHRFERDVFVNEADAPLSDHDPLAVDWDWSALE
jgi:endonuclease/exonuclease/phosphatase family metal-dependent hydrolase